MFQRIQCVNKPRGASGSSTIKTRDFAPLGTPLIFSSGFTFAPLHVNFAGMSPPVWKAEVATEKEEAAFILKIVPMKIARANAISFIQQTLAVSGCGQGNERAPRPDAVRAEGASKRVRPALSPPQSRIGRSQRRREIPRRSERDWRSPIRDDTLCKAELKSGPIRPSLSSAGASEQTTQRCVTNGNQNKG